MATAGVFLSAEWRYLAMLNYAIDPAVLAPYVPRGTELDAWHGMTFVSIVGFLFRNTRVRGLAIPFHQHFEEVNLRFYVRCRGEDAWQRGVVFIKEIVPRRAIATVARLVYNERYVALPMRHVIDHDPANRHLSVEYAWRFNQRWNHLRVIGVGAAQPIAPGSEEEFITEHYWGYTAQRDGSCLAYQVEHPGWRVWPVSDWSFDCDVAALYGQAFVECLQAAPRSAFLADGSPVVVRAGQRLPPMSAPLA